MKVLFSILITAIISVAITYLALENERLAKENSDLTRANMTLTMQACDINKQVNIITGLAKALFDNFEVAEEPAEDYLPYGRNRIPL